MRQKAGIMKKSAVLRRNHMYRKNAVFGRVYVVLRIERRGCIEVKSVMSTYEPTEERFVIKNSWFGLLVNLIV